VPSRRHAAPILTPVALRTVAPRATTVVALATTWERFPAEWPGLLAELRAALPAAAHTALNVMLYRGDVPHVEVGLPAEAPADPPRRIVASALPGGTVATTKLRGGYDGLPAAHQAVRDWCAAEGHRLAGPRWEVYGHWHDDPERVETDIAWLLA
jgi:hypothetical protein